ncbi:MAG TPA: hypothetical protein IAB31_03920, partial [Candidatus Choladousia intestinavium]|nr:hypothetical protein [Candidatus Choladousia intestinavium]
MCKNSGGIYVILNLIDCKAYVGQAKNFSNRTHTLELYGGNDNNKALQTDYMNDDLELIYFVIGRYVGKYINDYDKHTFDRYEKLFMTLMEDLGFSLYNRNIKREDRTFEKLKFSEKDYDDALKELKNDFIIRFNMDPDYLSRASIPVRQQALDFYADKRLKSSNASSTSSDVNFG